jgi:hypothetical protein
MKTVLVADNINGGHHPIYRQAVAEALAENHFVLCAGPENAGAAISPWANGQNIRHISHKPTLTEKVLRRLQKELHSLVGIKNNSVLAAYKWAMLKKMVSTETGKIDHIVLLYADDYASPHTWVPAGFPPWSGLCINTTSLRKKRKKPAKAGTKEPLGGMRHAKTIYCLDSGIEKDLAALTGRPVVHFPDFADVSIVPSELSQALVNRCQGRPTLGVFGTLGGHKNISGALELARRMPNLNVLIAGPYFPQTMSRAERKRVERLKKLPNVIGHWEKVPTDQELNHLHSICCCLFAAYTGFDQSSNKLAKAAGLKVPLIVSEGTYMAEMTEAHYLGKVADPHGTYSMESALREIMAQGWQGGDGTGYLKGNSKEDLPSVLEKIWD